MKTPKRASCKTGSNFKKKKNIIMVILSSISYIWLIILLLLSLSSTDSPFSSLKYPMLVFDHGIIFLFTSFSISIQSFPWIKNLPHFQSYHIHEWICSVCNRFWPENSVTPKWRTSEIMKILYFLVAIKVFVDFNGSKSGRWNSPLNPFEVFRNETIYIIRI